VVVTLPPLAWAAEMLRVNGIEPEIHVLLPEGASPHGWEPSPSDAALIARADVVLTAGTEDNAAVDRLARKSGTLVVSMQDLAREGESVGEHPWLKRFNMVRFVHKIQLALGFGLIPDHPDPRRWPDFYGVNAPSLIITGHDAWDGFFEELGSEVLAVHSGHHHEASAERLASILQRAKEADLVLVVFESGVPDSWLRALAEDVGAATVTLDPVGTRDWLGDMQKRYEAVGAALESLE